ncbi:PaeR7I family type II restriction endonuclease [Micromonospora parva]|uniref:PaeR7I family type II restriction endonuclease n=1 Tax=Micromonospora parva TaxID=1464048 RepID=UPI0033F491E4
MNSTTDRVGVALQSWVDVRREQAARSEAGGRAQQGRRSAVTGGLHLAALNQLVVDEIHRTGATDLRLLTNRQATLASYYRSSKSWDLVVLKGDVPILAVEYKSMSGSEGKNLNNRADEVFGIAEDARQAERHGILPANMRRAYIFVMGINPDSARPVGVGSPLGSPDPIFKGASYLQRTAIMCKRMRDSGLYHLTWAVGVTEEPFSWTEPDREVGWDRFVADLRRAFPGGTPAPNPEIAR